MTKKDSIKTFEDSTIRTVWDSDKEKWYISIVDVVAILTESPRPRKYWNALKTKLKEEGSQLSQNLGRLKMKSSDGKLYTTDVADTEQLFRLIQSIPSPKAEPFKLWLAQIASERLDEMQDTELTIDRALKEYLELGYSENWINQRLKSIEVRKELTDKCENCFGRKEKNEKTKSQKEEMIKLKEHKIYVGTKEEYRIAKQKNMKITHYVS